MAKPTDPVQGTPDVLILNTLSLTRAGEKQLERELANPAILSTAINILVQETSGCGF